MTGRERVEAVIRLERPDKVPVAPLINEHAAKVLGVPLGDCFSNPELATRAALKCYEVYPGMDMAVGSPFGIAYLSPYVDAHSSWFFHWVLPQPGQDEVPQMLENLIIAGEDYDLLMEKGLLYFLRPDRPQLNSFLQLFVSGAAQFKPLADKIQELDLFVYAGSLINIPTDVLANLRGLQGYLTDFIDRPQKMREVCEWMVDDLIALGLQLVRQAGAGLSQHRPTVLLGANRASATYVSPKMFEEVAWPFFYKEVMAIIAAGCVPVIHLDGNWTPMAKYFRAFPKATCLFHLDDQNDIFQWKKILGDHSALMGNVPATLLAHGTAAEVDAYCKRVIEEVGEGGGLILANACAMPHDARIENVRAMIRATERYGAY